MKKASVSSSRVASNQAAYNLSEEARFAMVVVFLVAKSASKVTDPAPNVPSVRTASKTIGLSGAYFTTISATTLRAAARLSPSPRDRLAADSGPTAGRSRR